MIGAAFYGVAGLEIGRHAFAGELVGGLVAGIARVALDPVPFDIVSGGDFVQALPEVGVLHRFLVGGPPAVPLPAVDPQGDTVTNNCGLSLGWNWMRWGFYLNGMSASELVDVIQGM